MALIELKVKHGLTQAEARDRLSQAVGELQSRFGPMVRSCDWSPARDSVVFHGPGVRLELRIDPVDVHVSGDIPILSSLLGKDKVKQIVEATFK